MFFGKININILNCMRSIAIMKVMYKKAKEKGLGQIITMQDKSMFECV